MSASGQATSAGDRTTSDLPPGTDIGDGEGDVREVPSPDKCAPALQLSLGETILDILGRKKP
jgi:hypothetical protein